MASAPSPDQKPDVDDNYTFDISSRTPDTSIRSFINLLFLLEINRLYHNRNNVELHNPYEQKKRNLLHFSWQSFQKKIKQMISKHQRTTENVQGFLLKHMP